MSSNDNTVLLFPWGVPDATERSEAIKWQNGNSKHEIYIPVLKDLSIDTLLPHCVSVKAKIEAAVSTATHLGPSFFRVFPRTVSPVLRTIWQQIVADKAPVMSSTNLLSTGKLLTPKAF